MKRSNVKSQNILAKRVYRRKSTIPRSLSTYSRDQVALPATKIVTFQYDSVLAAVSSIGQVLSLPVALNDINDFDRSTGNAFGNKQPLYHDTLVNSSNYTNTRVESWEVTFSIVNTGTTPMQVFCVSASNSTAAFDSETKASNLPGVQKIDLTSGLGSKSHCTVTIYGTPKDLYSGYPMDSGLSAGFSGSPANVVFGGITLYVPSGTINATVSVKAKLRTKLFVRTAVIS
jgi:hypothetical protein